MTGRCDPAKAAAWRERFSRWELSPLKTAEFCATEGVSVASFYAWRRKLNLVAKPRANQPAQRGAFEQLLVSSLPTLSARLPGGIELEATGASEQALRTLVSELVRAAREVQPC